MDDFVGIRLCRTNTLSQMRSLQKPTWVIGAKDEAVYLAHQDTIDPPESGWTSASKAADPPPSVKPSTEPPSNPGSFETGLDCSRSKGYRGTSPIRNSPTPRIIIGP